MQPLIQRPDGLVGSDQPALLPIMAPRLQGEATADGRLDLSLWGAGRLGLVRFSGLAGPFVYGPNRITARHGGVFVAQSAPVLVIRGARLERLYPARRSAWWTPALAAPAPVVRDDAARSVDLPWGSLIAEPRGKDLVIAVGADRAEAQRALALTVDEIDRQADAYAARCDVLPTADPLLRGMAIQAAHAALSSIRQDEQGAFAGLAAGAAYSAPARTYYRDGYWTALTLLRLAPEAVREEIDFLARGVQPDGSAPSGLVLPTIAETRAWQAARRSRPDLAVQPARPLDWWSDHFDSPLLFVLMLGDYVSASGDVAAAERHWPAVKAIYARYRAMAEAGGGLPRKPRNDRDWADNVFRAGLVAYDLGLWVGALDAIARLGRRLDPPLAAKAEAAAQAARPLIESALARPQGGWADYADGEGFVEDHLSLDSLTLLRFDAVLPAAAGAALAEVRARLESRHNVGQPWGDWGMLSVWPPYRRRGDLRAKSAFALRYHNGGDWPWLDGLYAAERLRRGLAGWRYPMLRWWRACLDVGWLGAVEHYSPRFGRGSLIQAWSSLPLAAALDHEGVVLAGDDEASPRV